MSGGIDPVTAPIPVAPAAHFHMGGVAVDSLGRTSLDGLFACGEVASSGAHGANRLASNSLLEAAVFGARIARAIDGHAAPAATSVAHLWDAPPRASTGRGLVGDRWALRRLMTECAGLERSAGGLRRALGVLGQLDDGPDAANGGLAIVGTLIAGAALLRRESRGGHYRTDHPLTDEKQTRRTVLTLDEARAVARHAAGAPFRGPDSQCLGTRAFLATGRK